MKRSRTTIRWGALGHERQFTNGFPPLSAEEIRARRAWLRYHATCETYDRTLPGMWHPRAPDEWLVRPDVRHLSLAFARREREKLRDALRSIPREIEARAEQAVKRMSYAAVTRELEDLQIPAGDWEEPK